MKTAWLSLLALGIAGSIATACTISSGDGDGLGGSSGDSGGSTAAGGAGSGGAKGGTTAAGGAAAGGKAAGGAASGGTSSGGAASLEPVVKCDTLTSSGTPAPSCTFDAPDDTVCHKCLSKVASCCDAVKQCYGFGPGLEANQCAYGGPDGSSEFTCFEDCIVGKAKAGGGDYQMADVDFCTDKCATPACGLFVGNATNDLIACMTNECEKECILDPAKP